MSNKVDISFFTNREKITAINGKETKKFLALPTLKCKFCGLDYRKDKLKYHLSTKNIIETDKLLKQLGYKMDCIENRPDLQLTYSSTIYIPNRVCEDWYTYNILTLFNYLATCYLKQWMKLKTTKLKWLISSEVQLTLLTSVLITI